MRARVCSQKSELWPAGPAGPSTVAGAVRRCAWVILQAPPEGAVIVTGPLPQWPALLRPPATCRHSPCPFCAPSTPEELAAQVAALLRWSQCHDQLSACPQGNRKGLCP